MSVCATQLNSGSITGGHWEEVCQHELSDQRNDSQRIIVESDNREMADLTPQYMLQMIENLTQIYARKNLILLGLKIPNRTSGEA